MWYSKVLTTVHTHGTHPWHLITYKYARKLTKYSSVKYGQNVFTITAQKPWLPGTAVYHIERETRTSNANWMGLPGNSMCKNANTWLWRRNRSMTRGCCNTNFHVHITFFRCTYSVITKTKTQVSITQYTVSKKCTWYAPSALQTVLANLHFCINQLFSSSVIPEVA